MKFAGIIKNYRKQNIQNEITGKITKNFPFSTKLENKHLILFFSSNLSKNDKDNLLQNQSNILIGRLFDRATYQEFTNSTFQGLKSTADTLANSTWGKYICFNFSEKDECVNIFNDPTGQISFFYCVTKEVIFFSSDIQIIKSCLPDFISVNEKYFINYLLNCGSTQNEKTAFNNILELPAGCVLHIKNEKIKTGLYYTPFNLQNKKFPITAHSSLIIDTLTHSIQSWAEPYESILVTFSGGVDSTAVLTCLNKIAKPHQKISAINYSHSEIAPSNESEYAKNICKKLNIDLISLELAEKNLFSESPHYPNSPQPYLLSIGSLNKLTDYINPNQSTLVINGQGGDHLFLCPPPKTLAIDALLDKKWSLSCQKLKELAYYYREPYLPIFLKNLKNLFQYFYNFKKNSFVTNELTEAWFSEKLNSSNSIRQLPYFYSQICKSTPGRFAQLLEFYNGISSLKNIEHLDLTCPSFSPFLYPPLAELALNIPTYELFNHAFDRYPLRKAIDDEFSMDFIWRKNKGETSGVFQLALKKNLPYIRQLCLEGYCAKNKLIKKDFLELALLKTTNGEHSHMRSILNLLSLELFYAKWF